MMTDLKFALLRSRRTLVQDTLGATALIVMLMVALHLPGLL
ncbi:hypothetical protein [Albibacillus kandeliae]|jgi:hypothetical protein|nr:hypothetical protein [Albibacillus kandeliae]